MKDKLGRSKMKVMITIGLEMLGIDESDSPTDEFEMMWRRFQLLSLPCHSSLGHGRMSGENWQRVETGCML